MKRILYLHHTPFFRGSATSLSYLLKELDRSKYEPHMVLTEDGPARQAFEGIGLPVRICKVPMAWEAPSPPWWHPNRIRNRLAFTASAKFSQLLEEIKPDILHINDTCSISAAISAKKIGIPVVCHVRSVHRTKYFGAAKLVRQIYESSDILIPISEEYAIQFPDKTKLRTVYNSIDFKSIDSAKGKGAEIRRELHIPDPTVLIGMVGTLSAHKGAWDFIEAARITSEQIREQRINLKFLIIGSIPGFRWFNHFGIPYIGLQVQNFISKHGLQDKIILTGHRKDIYDVMDALDIVVFPTRLDATGRPVFEGSALGKPVIATMPTKATRVLLDGTTGLITPPENPTELASAMTRLINDHKLRKNMGDAGKQHANEHFHAERNIIPIHQIYKGILG